MSKRAFTLIEVLASIVLIAVALIPIMTIVPQIIRNSVSNERLTTAIFLGEKKLEEVKRDAIYAYDTFDGNASATAFDSPYGTYKYTVTDDEAADIRVIQVQAWYDENDDDDDSGEESITIDTKIADRG